MIITIDGPSASGKSSVAQQLAQQLHLIHINSGYLYRAAAVLYLQLQPANFTDAAFLQVLTQLEYRYQPDTNLAQVFYQGQDLTPKLKTPAVSQLASVISAEPAVRAAINQLQRELVAQRPAQNYIADGRDCGSIVFPHADLKIFLTASPAVRAGRFCHSLAGSAAALTLAECTAELAQRDQRDTTRPVAPLVVPAGAVVIDSSALTLAQVIAQLKALILASF